MRVFTLVTPADAMARMFDAMERASSYTRLEVVDSLDALHRIIAQDIVADVPMPEFRRSTVDGFAVRSMDLGDDLILAGESVMGELVPGQLGAGQAMKIHTGGSVPVGSDAILMVEDSRISDDGLQLRATRPKLTPGENIIEIGEDVHAGAVVISAGSRLREAEIGGLAALGVTRISVYARPRVAIIASGDEVIPPSEKPRAGQVRDVNSYTVGNLVRANGGIPVYYDIVRDDPSTFMRTAETAHAECDMLIFMAGSSVSERDHTPDVVAKLGNPGVLAHGIAFRPGKPTLFAVCGGKPIMGLPGNPVSALVTARLFATKIIWKIQGATRPPIESEVSARLSVAMASPKNLEHWFGVKLDGDQCVPVLAKSNLIFSLTRADGMVCVPIGMDHLEAGSTVKVRLF